MTIRKMYKWNKDQKAEWSQLLQNNELRDTEKGEVKDKFVTFKYT